MATPVGFPSRLVDLQWFPDPVIVADRVDVAATRLHSDIGIPLRNSIPYVIDAVRRTFSSEGKGSWKPWAVEGVIGPSGLEYTQGYEGRRLLQRGGDLKDHATSPESFAVAGNTLVYEPEGIKDLVFSIGGNYSQNIWERPFMGLDAKGEIEVEIVFREWLSGIISFIEGGGGVGGERFEIRGRSVFRPRSNLGTFLPGGRG